MAAGIKPQSAVAAAAASKKKAPVDKAAPKPERKTHPSRSGKRKPKDDAAFVKQMGYVEQFGVHSPASTVYESLYFSAAH